MEISAETVRHVQLLVDGYLQAQTDVAAGPVTIRCGSALVHIRLVDCEPVIVRVFSPVVKQIPATADLLTELNRINANTNFIRLFWRDDTVYAADELLATTLDLDELVLATELVADVADHYDGILRDRFGGVCAVGE